jgi:capsular exopolysaccharide synthesis family protein
MTAHPGSSRHASRAAKHPTEYLRILYKRRWIAIPAFLIVFLTGAIDSVRTVPVFEARTQLLIEEDARRATSLSSVLDDRQGWRAEDFYVTQQRILESRALAERAALALRSGRPEQVPPPSRISLSPRVWFWSGVSWVTGLFSSPEPAPADAPSDPAVTESAELRGQVSRLMGGLSVLPIRNSRLMELRYRSPDRVFAARAVNEIANQYIQQSVAMRLDTTLETSNFLRERLEEQRQKVEEADRRLQEYKVTNNALAVDDRQNIVVQKLTALNNELTQAKIERMAREAEYQGLLRVRENGGSIAGAPLIAADEVIQKLNAEIVSARGEKATLESQGYGPNYTPMRTIDSRIAVLESQLEREIDLRFDGVRLAFERARANEESLAQALEAQKGEALGLDAKQLEFAALEREATSARELYEDLLQRTNETSVSSEYRGTSIQVVDPAEIPQGHVLPQVSRDLTKSALIGLALALGLVFGVEYFDSRLKSPDEVKAHLDLPFLGMIPAAPTKDTASGEAPLLVADSSPAFSEAMRAVRTAVLFSSADEGARSVVITSTGPHEGKTLVSSSLAITLAQAGQRTLVIDADMRRPRLHEALDRSQEPGLSNVLVGDTAVGDAARPTAVPNLWLLSAGHIPPNPAELLGSRKFNDLFAELKRRYDWIVIDAPPVMPVTDASVLAHAAGGVLFVVGAEMTPRQSAQAAIEQLRSAKARFVGVVLNRVNVHRHSYYYSPYYRKSYGKYYQRSTNQA